MIKRKLGQAPSLAVLTTPHWPPLPPRRGAGGLWNVWGSSHLDSTSIWTANRFKPAATTPFHLLLSFDQPCTFTTLTHHLLFSLFFCITTCWQAWDPPP
jgi:hypothetical protein